MRPRLKSHGRAALVSLLAAVLSVAAAASAPGAGPATVPGAPAVRVDFRTVLITPSNRAGRVHVNEFIGFRVPEGASNPAFLLCQPVEGTPDSVQAQPMALADFDKTFTHAADLEGAFHERVRVERAVSGSLFGAIGLNGGLPAWLLLAVRWPLGGPPITAVVAPPAAAQPLPLVQECRVLSAADLGSAVASLSKLRGSPDPGAPARSALRRLNDGCLIAVSIVARATPPRDMEQPAACGVWLSYDAPLSRDAKDAAVERFFMPLVRDPQSGPPAVTRIYVVIPPNRAGGARFGAALRGAASSQKLVNDALAAFGSSEAFRRAWAREHAGARVDFVRAAGGKATTRLTAAFKNVTLDSMPGDIVLTQRRSAAGVAKVLLQKAGAVLLGALRPLTLLLYLLAVACGIRVYLWLVGAPQSASTWRRYALIAAFSPILTPWFMLRYAGGAAGAVAKEDDSSALGFLSASSYDCLARLITWGLLLCVSWAVMAAIARFALSLRFG